MSITSNVKNSIKRTIAMTLVFVMCISMFPSSVIAEEAEYLPYNNIEDTVNYPIGEISGSSTNGQILPENPNEGGTDDSLQNNEQSLPLSGDLKDENGADADKTQQNTVVTGDETYGENQEPSDVNDSDIGVNDTENQKQTDDNDSDFGENDASAPQEATDNEGQKPSDADDANVDATDVEEPQEEPDGDEPEKNEREEPETEANQEPRDLTNMMDHVRLSLTDWRILGTDGTETALSMTDGYMLDLSPYAAQGDTLTLTAALGFELLQEVHDGDYVAITFPGTVYADTASGSMDFSSDGTFQTGLVAVQNWDNRVNLVFTQLNSIRATGKLTVTMTVDTQQVGNTIWLQADENTGAYTCVELLINAEGIGDLVSNLNEIDPEDLNPDDNATFTIYGDLRFIGEEEGGMNWTPILRPETFNQKIQVIAQKVVMVEDEDGQEVPGLSETEIKVIDTQTGEKFKNYYLEITHDGSGAGSFVIENVPETVTDGMDTYKVTKVVLSNDNTVPYYEAGEAVSLEANSEQNPVVLTECVKFVDVTLKKEVLPVSAAGGNYKIDGTFTRINSKAAEEKVSHTYTVSSAAPSEEDTVSAVSGTNVKIPSGIKYVFEEQQSAEYVTQGYKVNEGNLQKTAEGYAVDPVAITTVNISKNVSVPFRISWYDNNDVNSRPSAISSELFTLEYKTADGEWSSDLDAIEVSELNIVNLGFGNYAVVQLPGATANGEVLEYRLSENQETIQNYIVETIRQNDGTVWFKNTLKTEMNFTIEWRDNNETQKRPDESVLLELLQLSRQTRNSAKDLCEIKPEQVEITADGNVWKVKIVDLPRYNSSNYEYDYSIQLSEAIQGDGYAYDPYYNNSENTHGSDLSSCYNGGRLINQLNGIVDFHATKVWADDKSDDSNDRPEVTVTLYRYAAEKNNGNADSTPTEAARVTYYDKDGNGTLLSYTLKNSGTEDIRFTSETVINLPENFQLPMYDEFGRKYTYYVTETMGSYNGKGNYTTVFPDGWDGVGAPNGGTLTNVYREKAKIDVSKAWLCPADLDNVENTTVQVQLVVVDEEGNQHVLPAVSSVEGDYTVLPDDEQMAVTTIKDFSKNRTEMSTSFYVNLYDENGHRFDLSNAVIKEVQILKDGQPIEMDNDAFTINGDRYKVASFQINGDSYSAYSQYEGGVESYGYELSNIIDGTRDYEIVKRWDESISDAEMEKVDYITFRVIGVSEDPIAPKTYEKNDVTLSCDDALEMDPRTWDVIVKDLPQYDENGYAYVYTAEETSVVSNGETKSWSVHYSRTPGKTVATNYNINGDGFWLYLTKEWNDNGDDAYRQPVQIGIYKKADLVSAESLHDVMPAYTVTLEEGNVWYAEINIKEGTREDYVAVEYSAANEFYTEYASEDLQSILTKNEAYDITGSVITSNRNYSVLVDYQTLDSERDGFINVVNTRVGTIDLVVNKTWKDGNNVEGNRPQTITFQLFENNAPMVPTSEFLSLYSKENAEVNGLWIDASGIVTVIVSADGSETVAEIKGLPMFDKNSIPVRYDLRESGLDELKADDYVSSKEETIVRDVAGENDHSVYTYPITNSKSGSTDFTCFKLWKDLATNGKGRPDLYLRLYRYAYDSDAADHGESTAVEIPSGQIWTALIFETSQKHWEIQVNGLPKYSENGERYVYYMREEMNNNGENSYGQYLTAVENEIRDPVTGATEIDTSKSYALDGGTFVNTLDAEMKVNGVKVWNDLPEEFPVEELPKPIAQLYRTLRHDFDPAQYTTAQIEEMAADNTSGIEYIDSAEISDTKTFELPTQEWKEEHNVEYLPKYSEDGDRYLYFVKEKLSPIPDQLFESTVNGNVISNVFTDQDRREIEVSKTFDRTDVPEGERDLYPSVTFTLERYIAFNELGNKVENPVHSVVAIQTIPSSEFVQGNGTASAHFTDLLIYSPTGAQYGYEVKEEKINGYDSQFVTSSKVEDLGGNAWGTVTSLETPNVVKVTNTYKVERITLTGTKTWADYSDLMVNIRPDDIRLVLVRNPGNTVIDLYAENKTADSPEITWEKQDNLWTYTITNLVKYAPNGKPYTYTVSEDPVSAPGYVLPNSSTVTAADGAKFPGLTNDFGASYLVRKDWSDGSDKYGFRPETVTMLLQRAHKGTDEWENIPYLDVYGNTFDSVEVNGTNVICKVLTAENVIKNTNDNSWSYTFKNLPGYWLDDNKVAQPWEYRCVEFKVGTSPVQVVDGEEQSGSYKVTYVMQNASRTQVRNDLITASLDVNKVWDNDQGNKYLSRPNELKFRLEMIVKTADGSLVKDWCGAPDADDPYIFTLYSGNGWKATLTDLPKYDAEGNYIYYRAVELTNDDGTVQGAIDYADITDYEKDWNTENDLNTIQITNSLRVRTIRITASKLWENENNNTPAEKVEFELQYSTDNGNKWVSYSPKLTETITKDTPAEKRNVEWTQLPICTTDGKTLTYRVVEYAVNGYSTNVVKTESELDENLQNTIDYTFTNIEDRGVLTFTKKGSNGPLISHADAEGESTVYFGVFTDSGCQNQVAGMQAVSKDTETVMVLTNADADGNLLDKSNASGVKYLYNFGSGVYTGNDKLALLSGTYYIKELRAPAGYKLSTTVNTAVIGKVDQSKYSGNNLSEVYAANAGTVGQSKSYEWSNTENVVSIYKMDQYGKKVDLGDGFLLLTAPEGTTFLNGQTTIELKTSNNIPQVAYLASEAKWTLTGIFDGDESKIYTLSEPDSSVPDAYLKADEITFKVDSEGKIVDVSGGEASNAPKNTDGSNYGNTYLAGTDNTIVLRDVARYGTVVLTKISNSLDSTVIPNISFSLYKYAGAEPVYGQDQPILPDGALLVTGQDGKIDLSESDLINQETGKALKYGLTVGKYYFYEEENGASDKYSLESRLVPFEVISDAPNLTTRPGATVTKLNPADNNDTVINTPVIRKSVELNKVNADGTGLENAEFSMTYVSITDNQDGSSTMGTPVTTTYTTNQKGLLVDAAGNTPDISRKGLYTLLETKAPAGYMTITDANGNPVVEVKFEVGTSEDIELISKHENVTLFNSRSTESGDVALDITVANEKTQLSVMKRSDVKSDGSHTVGLDGEDLSGAILQILCGTTVGESWTSGEKAHTVTPGILREEVVYTLHEETAPAGYAKAADLYFKINGTTVVNGENVSVVYVWTGNGTPNVSETEDWSRTASLDGLVLTMVDEALYAPISLKKNIGEDGTALADAIFTVINLDDNSEIGTAKTGTDGYLVWKTPVQSSVIFDANGNRKAAAEGSAIILQQNTKGYKLVETQAPANAYMNGLTYVVSITEESAKAFVNNKNLVINAVDGTLTEKSAFASVAKNPAFTATIVLNKFDAENETINEAKNNYSTIGIPGTEFELKKGEDTLDNVTSTEGGLVTITISEQGTYTLKEITPAKGYILPDPAPSYTFTIVNSDQGKTLTYSETADNHTAEVAADTAHYGVSNQRIHGAMELIKIDADTSATDNKLNDVTFTLTRLTENVNDTWFKKDTSITVKTGYAFTIGDNKTVSEQGTAGEKGKLVITNLPWGEYELVETAPDGYKPNNNKYTFTVNADSITERIVVSDDGTVIKNFRNQLNVTKTDPYGNVLWQADAEKQAKFQLFAVVGDTVGTEAVKFFNTQSAAEKVDTLCAGEGFAYCIPVGTYILREVSAPEGYQMTLDVLFKMNADATISGVQTVNVENGVYTPADKSNVTSDGITITVKDDPETIEIPITKIWDDEDDHDRCRPSQITLTLTGKVQSGAVLPEQYTVTKIVEGDPKEAEWTYTFTDIPAYYGNEIVGYELTEASIENYGIPNISGDNNGFEITNTHDRETIKVTVTKKWEINTTDPNFAIPEKVSVQLYADVNTYGNPIELTKDSENPWSYTWEGLPKNKDGNIITYTVKEVGVLENGRIVLGTDTYVVSYSGDMDEGLIVTNTYDTVQLNLEKLWDDNSDEEKLRPETISVELIGNEKNFGSYELKKENDWKLQIINLPKYDNDAEEIKWSLKEEPFGSYMPDYPESELYKLFVENTLEYVDIPVEKLWDDADNEDGYRPTTITLTVTGSVKDNTIVLPERYTVTEVVEGDPKEDTWSYTFKNLLKYYDGEEVVYTLTEEKVDQYDEPIISGDNNGFEVSNPHERETTEVTVTKNWILECSEETAENFIIPESVHVQLMANDEPLGDPIELNEENEWTYTWKELWKNTAGEEIQYTVQEVDADENDRIVLEGNTYTVSYEGDMYEGFTVVNTYEVVTLNLEKIWKDENNVDQIRPNKVKVHLIGNKKEYGEFTLDAANGWKLTVIDLPKYENGIEIKWTLKEDAVNGYKADYSVKENTLTVTNSHSKNPKTGDDSNMFAYALAAGLSLAGLAVTGLTAVRKKKNRNNA